MKVPYNPLTIRWHSSETLWFAYETAWNPVWLPVLPWNPPKCVETPLKPLAPGSLKSLQRLPKNSLKTPPGTLGNPANSGVFEGFQGLCRGLHTPLKHPANLLWFHLKHAEVKRFHSSLVPHLKLKLHLCTTFSLFMSCFNLCHL